MLATAVFTLLTAGYSASKSLAEDVVAATWDFLQ